MSQTYTLDEAAEKLNLSVEEFKRRLRTEWSNVRAFRDGSTLRFRANEVDELARSIGLGSSEELPLAESSPLDLPAEVGLAAEPAKADPNAPLKLDDSDEVFLLAPDASGKPPSSKKLKSKSDSDVRLEKSAPKTGVADDEESILTEEVQKVGEGGSGKLSGRSGKLSSAQLKTGDSGRHKQPEAQAKSDSSRKLAAAEPPADDSSEFELTLDADSDEFELSLAPDSSEEVALGEMPAGTPAGKSGNSGINLNRPTDSGVSLEKRKKPDEEEVDFELSLETPGSGSSRKKLGGSGSKLKPDSDSEFELTLEEPSDLGVEVTGGAPGEKKGDIFEATDFEIPALEDDSASEAVSLEESDTDLESSDFDLALDEADVSAEDESASEVVALADAPKGRGKRKRVDDDDDGAVDLGDDLEEGPSASKALRGARREEVDEDEDYEVSEAAEEELVAAPSKWGPIPAIGMFLTVLIMFLGGLMAYELLHSVWGYQQSAKPTTPLVSWFAETTGMKTTQ